MVSPECSLELNVSVRSLSNNVMGRDNMGRSNHHFESDRQTDTETPREEETPTETARTRDTERHAREL